MVVDLGFGDSGKGLMTDALVRQMGARLVVRFNGGAQAGHNVVTPEGRHHTFTQLGAGSFVPGARTHLSADVVVHPGALLLEAMWLHMRGTKGPLARLTVDPDARVVTLFQQAAGRLRELARGPHRHGTCGVGIGETMRDAGRGRVLRAGELGRVDLPSRMRRWQEEKRTELAEIRRQLRTDPRAEHDLRVLETKEPLERWLETAGHFVREVTLGDEQVVTRCFAAGERVVFEGAQGVLLDETHGFHPHTTWSTCTFSNAEAITRRANVEALRLGVVRMYLTRHGEGPLPTFDPALDALVEPHNAPGGAAAEWQGRFRRGWPDPLLLRYAIGAVGGIDALALTHLDARVPIALAAAQAKTGGTLRIARAYEWAHGERWRDIPRHEAPTLDRQEALGQRLATATVDYDEPCWTSDDEVTRFFAETSGAPLAYVARGPTAADVRAVAAGVAASTCRSS